MTERKEVEYCVSCNVRLSETGAVKFKCPSCGELIGRCGKCRQQSNPFTCKKCGFRGP